LKFRQRNFTKLQICNAASEKKTEEKNEKRIKIQGNKKKQTSVQIRKLRGRKFRNGDFQFTEI
jgi:hypothetical protein